MIHAGSQRLADKVLTTLDELAKGKAEEREGLWKEVRGAVEKELERWRRELPPVPTPKVLCVVRYRHRSGTTVERRVVGMYREGTKGALKLASLSTAPDGSSPMIYAQPWPPAEFDYHDSGFLDFDRVAPAFNAGGGGTWTFRRSRRVVLPREEVLENLRRAGVQFVEPEWEDT